jgi:coproporphyrinogen III oxidase-like Fe-S oxidoreductase
MLSLDTLPGTLTLDKVKEIAIETEVELVDFERFDAYGKMHYSRDAEASGDGR